MHTYSSSQGTWLLTSHFEFHTEKNGILNVDDKGGDGNGECREVDLLGNEVNGEGWASLGAQLGTWANWALRSNTFWWLLLGLFPELPARELE